MNVPEQWADQARYDFDTVQSRYPGEIERLSSVPGEDQAQHTIRFTEELLEWLFNLMSK